MTVNQFDAAQYKAGQRTLWNVLSPAWETWQSEFECALCLRAVKPAVQGGP